MKKSLLIIFCTVVFTLHTWDISHAAYYVFIPDNAGNTVSIFRIYRAEDGAPYTTPQPAYPLITVGSNPFGIAVSDDEKAVYVTNSGENTITYINTDIEDAARFLQPVQITVGNGPRGVAVSPDGKWVYVANYSDNTVSIINVDVDDDDIVDGAFTDIRTAGVGGSPYGVAVSPSGSYVYITNSGEGSITIIDSNPASSNFLGTTPAISAGTTPSGIAASPSGYTFYGVNSGSNSISVFDATASYFTTTPPGATKVIEENMGSEPRGIAITPEGSYIYVTNFQSNSVSKIQISNYTLIETIAVGAGPLGITVTPDGNHIYVANSGDGTLSEIDVDISYFGTVAPALPIGGTPAALGQFVVNLIHGPTLLNAVVVSPYQADLSWTDNSPDEVGFKIEIKVSGYFQEVDSIDANATAYSHTGLRPKSTYTYRVRAFDDDGYSAYSNEITITTPEDDKTCFIGVTTPSWRMPLFLKQVK